MSKMKYFPEMTGRQFSAATKHYKEKGALENAKYWEYLANGFNRYTETGRVDTLNTLVTVALAMGRYRSFVRVTKSLCAHEWDDKTRSYGGKADKKKLKRLRGEVKDAGGVLRWEQDFYDHLQKETAFLQQKPAKTWDEDTCILSFVKQLAKHGIAANTKDVISRIEKAAKEVQVKAVTKAA